MIRYICSKVLIKVRTFGFQLEKVLRLKIIKKHPSKNLDNLNKLLQGLARIFEKHNIYIFCTNYVYITKFREVSENREIPE